MLGINPCLTTTKDLLMWFKVAVDSTLGSKLANLVICG